MLTGLLKTPDGAPWHGNRSPSAELYRAQTPRGSRNMLAARVERAVIETVAQDLQSLQFVRAAVKSLREKFAVTHAQDTDAQVKTMLGRMADEMQLYERSDLKDFLTAILDRVEPDADDATLQLCYRIPLRSGYSLASPGGFEPPLPP